MISMNKASRLRRASARAVMCCAALLFGCGTNGDDGSVSSTQNALFASPQFWPLSMGRWDYLANVDGGKTDAVLRVGSQIEFSVSTGTGFQQWTAQLPWLLSYDYQMADVTGDGKADIVGVGPTGDIMVSISMGTYFASGTVWNYWSGFYDHQFADVNGDGKADIIGVGPSGDIMVALSTGSAFGSGSVWQYWSSAYDHHFVDLNNDGRADAIGVNGSNVVVALSNGTSFPGPALTWATWSTSYSHRFIDVDADGNGDLIGLSATGDIKVALSTGSAFSPAASWGTAPNSGTGGASNAIDFADVGGDGKIDLLAQSPGSGGSTPGAIVQLGN
jgi:hypothetical protein